MRAVPKIHYTLEEYIELEKSSDERFEFFDGEVFAMAGGSLDHSVISGNVHSALKSKLAGRDCLTVNSDMRLKVPAAYPYRYPDAAMVCGQPIIEELFGQQMLVNPILIVEVLSKSTAAIDLGKKFLAYQSIASFREYLLVAQDQPYVIRHVRQADNRWLRSETTGLDAFIELESLGITLLLAELYQQIKFQPEPLSLVNPTPLASL